MVPSSLSVYQSPWEQEEIIKFNCWQRPTDKSSPLTSAESPDSLNHSTWTSTPVSFSTYSVLWLSLSIPKIFSVLWFLIGLSLFTPINTLIILGSNQAHSSSSSSSSSLGLSNLPQLLTAAAGAQGQILAVGPQVRSFLLKAKSFLKPCLNYLIDTLLFFLSQLAK